MSYQKPQKRVTMRERADEDAPRWVRGKDATPDRLGNPDDVAWAIAQELEAFFYSQKIQTGKKAAWLFKRGQYALDKSMLRAAYREHPERFRDANGKPMTLAEFGRKIVKYFKRNMDWGYAANADDVMGMFYDPVNIDECTKGLWRFYSNSRAKRGVS